MMILRRLTQHIKKQDWFAVFLDFLIVIFGILIAFQITNWNEKRKENADFQLAKAAIEHDLITSYFNAQERIALKACRIASLREISNRLLVSDSKWKGTPHNGSASNDLAINPVLRSPSRNWGSRTWQAELGRGTFNLMDPTRRNIIDATINLTDKAQRLQDEILSFEARLKMLSQDAELPKFDRSRYFEIISVIDQKSYLLERISEHIVRRTESLNIRVSEPYLRGISAGFPEYLEDMRDTYGDCARPLELFFLDTEIEEDRTN